MQDKHDVIRQDTCRENIVSSTVMLLLGLLNFQLYYVTLL